MSDAPRGGVPFSDQHAARVRAVTPAGELSTVIEVPNRPSGLGWDPEDRMLVVSMDDRRLLRFDGADLTEVTDVVTVDRHGAFACMHGRPDRTTLFVCTADASNPAETSSMRGAIEVCEVTIPGAGLP